MYHLTLTPQATIGLFVAHRAYDAKGSTHVRALVDADRVFLADGDAGLLHATADGKVETVAKEKIEVALENHVYEHLQRALTAAMESGTTFGFNGTPERPRVNPAFATEAEDALKAAEKRDAPATPKLVEKTPEKKGKKAEAS